MSNALLQRLARMFQHTQVSIQHVFCTASVKALTYYCCCLSLYQTQLFSLLPKQIESLITFHQPARATTPDQYPPPTHHICHSPLWNTLPTHKTNHPGSTYTLFLPLRLRTVPSALPATDSHLKKNQPRPGFGDEDDSGDISSSEENYIVSRL